MPKHGGYPGGMMPGNMNNLMKQAQKMQRQMEEQQKTLDEQQKLLEDKEYSASSGGGAVTVRMNGKREVLGLTLEPEVVDPDDIEMLQDLITAAVNEVLRQIEDDARKTMDDVTGGMGGMGGFSL